MIDSGACILMGDLGKLEAVSSSDHFRERVDSIRWHILVRKRYQFMELLQQTPFHWRRMTRAPQIIDDLTTRHYAATKTVSH